MRLLAGKDCGEFSLRDGDLWRHSLLAVCGVAFALSLAVENCSAIGLVHYDAGQGSASGTIMAKFFQQGQGELFAAGQVSISGYDLPVAIKDDVNVFFPPTFDKVMIERPGVADGGRGRDMAQDGELAVGYLDNGPGTPFHAFKWTAAGGIVDLGTLDAANNSSRSSFASGVSNDGSVIVGYSTKGPLGYNHAFRWTASGGMVALDPAAADNSSVPQSLAYSVSSDGSTIVGQRNFRAFRWTEAGGFASLGNAASFANAASGDGSVIVGQTTSGEAFRWTADEGVAPLGVLAGDTSSIATAVSDDGSVVVGISSTGFLGRGGSGNSITYTASQSRAFYWTADGGMQDLSQLLTASGAEMNGGKFAAALGISADGKWFGGAFTLPAAPSTQHPVFASLAFDVSTEPVPGDYNRDGQVDAADYTVWRDTLGATGSDLPADGSGSVGEPDGVVDDYDYAYWKARFGGPGGGGSANGASVPEPGTLGLIAFLTLISGAFRLRKSSPACNSTELIGA